MSDTPTHPQDSDHEEHIHMPPPSWAPIVIALGLTGIAFGLVISPVVLAAGILVFVIGFGASIAEDIRHSAVG